MIKIRETNDACEVEIREYGKDEKDIIMRYYSVDIKINDDFLTLDDFDFDTKKLKLYNKYSVKIYRYSEEPANDVHYYVDGYLIKNTKNRIKMCYDKLEIYELFGDFQLMVKKPKEYIVRKLSNNFELL